MADDSTSQRASKRRKVYGGARSVLSDMCVQESPTEHGNPLDGSNTVSNTTSIASKAAPTEVQNPADDNDTENADDELDRRKSKRRSAGRRKSEISPLKKMASTDTDVDVPMSTDTVTVEHGGDDDEVAESIQPRSSGRARRKPRRYSISPEKPKSRQELGIAEHPVFPTNPTVQKSDLPLKGILTPSKRAEKPGPRKSVIFEEDEKVVEEQLGFRDIGSKNATPKGQNSTSALLKKNKVKASDQRPSEPGMDEDKLVDIENEDSELIIDQLLHDQSVYEVTVSQQKSNSLGSDEQILDDLLTINIKSEVLGRLLGCKSSTSLQIPSHLQSQYNSLHNLLSATITSGESNSILLLGSRGAGKSHIVHAALSDLKAKHAADFHVVHLNGFFQTDDKLALREIWRQLGKEMQVDEDETETVTGSYADTMASLLSLLSHPDEYGSAERNGHIHSNEEEFTENLANAASKSIIFILDEFDLFTNHPRQTLLYNLFDIAQSRKAPIAVVGCSTRMDVVECLEKRVKSRFSHRWLHIPTAKSITAFEDVVKSAITLDADLADPKATSNETEARRKWNASIESTFLESAQIKSIIKRTFYSTKCFSDLFASLLLPLASFHVSQDPSLTKDSLPNSTVPSNLLSLCDLPTLHLSLLIAAARLDVIHNVAAVNLNLAHSHCTELVARSKLQQTASGAVAVGATLRQWHRGTARNAWEDLIRFGYLVPAIGLYAGREGTRDSVGGEGADAKMFKVELTLDDLSWALKEKQKNGKGSLDILEKWCKEV